MTSKKLPTPKTLHQIREENMAKWTEEDHRFYSDFLKGVPVKKKKKEDVAELREEEIRTAE